MTGPQKYPHMFEPLVIKGVRFKNRVAASPATTDRTVVDGCPTNECINAYEGRSRGGVGQVTVTETFVDFDYAARHDHSLDIVRKDMTVHHQESLYILTEAIKAHGAVASIQLNHIGALNHPSCIKDGKNPIGPVGYVRDDGVTVDGMDEKMMSDVADSFARAASCAETIGFDMVMLHGGHGWLLGQFLSPLTNTRTDEYGGSIENRAKFPIMVLDRIRQAVGPNFLIEYRISGAERVPGGLELEEAARFCELIQDKVDLIHVTAGMYHNHVQSKSFSSMYEEHGCNLDLAAEIKKHVNIPVVAVGGFNDPQQIEDAIAGGKCDMVAMGRQMLADPDFVNKTLMGHEDEIAPCLRCSCFNPLEVDPESRPTMRPFMCSVNPKSCRELRLQCAPRPNSSKNVLVVGGGPGGMYAAIAAAERGHKVTLLEKESSLGGLLFFTDTDVYKNDLRRYKESLKVRLGRMGVTVKLNTEATKETIESYSPDAVICAVGSTPIVPRIPGLAENARHALEVYRHPETVGKKVIMIGGGLIGCEAALHLTKLGHEVQIIELMDDIARDALLSHRQAIMPRLQAAVTISTGVKVIYVRQDGVTVENKDGSVTDFTADTVVFAIGMRSKSDVVESLRGSAPWFVEIGDCKKPGKVLNAVQDALYAAYDVL